MPFLEILERFSEKTAIPFSKDSSLFVPSFGDFFKADDGSTPTHFNPITGTTYLEEPEQAAE